MIKAAIVRAVAREDYPNGWWAAHRCWPPTPTVVEVVEQELDPGPGKDAKTGEVLEAAIEVPDETPVTLPIKDDDGNQIVSTKFYQNGKRRTVSKSKIGLKTLKALREQKGYLTVETRIVETLADVHVDSSTGDIAFDVAATSELASKDARIAELEAQVAELSRAPMHAKKPQKTGDA